MSYSRGGPVMRALDADRMTITAVALVGLFVVIRIVALPLNHRQHVADVSDRCPGSRARAIRHLRWCCGYRRVALPASLLGL